MMQLMPLLSPVSKQAVPEINGLNRIGLDVFYALRAGVRKFTCLVAHLQETVFRK
jgi:hypothetical protein